MRTLHFVGGVDDVAVAALFDEVEELVRGEVDRDVGIDAPFCIAVAAVEAFVVGEVVVGGGELHFSLGVTVGGAFGADGEEVLDRAFAEGAVTDDKAAVEVFHGSGENFGSAGAVLVDHDDQGHGGGTTVSPRAVHLYSLALAERPLVETMTPSWRNMSEISTAALRRPPGL